MDQADVLADRVRVKLAVSLAEIIAGVSDDIERLSQVLLIGGAPQHIWSDNPGAPGASIALAMQR